MVSPGAVPAPPRDATALTHSFSVVSENITYTLPKIKFPGLHFCCRCCYLLWWNKDEYVGLTSTTV